MMRSTKKKRNLGNVSLRGKNNEKESVRETEKEQPERKKENENNGNQINKKCQKKRRNLLCLIFLIGQINTA